MDRAHFGIKVSISRLYLYNILLEGNSGIPQNKGILPLGTLSQTVDLSSNSNKSTTNPQQIEPMELEPFDTQASFDFSYIIFKKITFSVKIRILLSGTLSQTQDLENKFATALHRRPVP